ncbi:Transcriptional regulator, TetR family [metagenome]|uniref:Transcriptional regulator, TetR family n=1 Tax=metagenome TaxID=256318 RepID=A0A2P2C967_9ZZZZ
MSSTAPPASRPAHRPSSREDILNSALDMLREGGAVSLDSAARAAGITKPGLMYHFPSKAALMSALVDRLVDDCARELRRRLPAETDAGFSVHDRLTAYLDWVCEGDFDSSDLVIFSDPRLREPLTTQWTERMKPWVEVPADLPEAERSRLLAVRLLADGIWFAAASNALPLADVEVARVRTLAHQLIQGPP